MIEDQRVLAIITARGGSKGIPGKNIVDFCGKPLIAWTIEEALQSKYIDRVIISTDDPSIAAVSEKFGAGVPFIRPAALAGDAAPSSMAIVHALEWIRDNSEVGYPLFVLLQPTSPLRNNRHIDEALEKFTADPHAKSLVSIRKVSENTAWMKKINTRGYLENLFIEPENTTRRQDLPELYYPNGAIYIMRSGDYLELKTFYIPECSFYLMDVISSADIDDRRDLKLAEILKKEEIL